MNTNSSSTSFSLDLPPLQLTNRRKHIRLNLIASLLIQLPDASWLTDNKWKSLEITRGPGLCLETKLRWNNHQVPEGLVEGFGHWISRAEMWSQLLFSTSLRVPARLNDGVDFKVGLIRSSPAAAAAEVLISTVRPRAPLSRISVEFSFTRTGPDAPSLAELAPIADTAFRRLWSRISDVAPVLGKVGYLESVGEKAEYVDVVANAITRVVDRSRGMGLKCAVDRLGVGGVEGRVWGVLLGVLRARKGGTGSRLKSMVQVMERAEDSGDLLFKDEGETDGDLWLGTETEDELFTWEGENGGYDEDSLFVWDDDECKDDPWLFEELEGPVVAVGYCGNEKDEVLFMEDSESMLEDGLLARSEDEDMILI